MSGTTREQRERLAHVAGPGYGLDDSESIVEGDGVTAADLRALLADAEALEQAREELERERVRLAGCGVVAMSDTPESAARNRPKPGDYGHSASMDDVARRVDECMSLRADLRAKLAEADAGWTAASAMYGAERDRAEASESLAAEAVRLLRRINDDATPSEPEDGSFAASRERYFAALTESRAFLARADVAALTKGENDGHE